MRFHHMAIFVSDLQEAIHLWRDVMGFELAVETVIPDGPAPGPTTFMYPALLDDIFKVKGARSKMALLSSPEGALIELQECEVPAIQKTPPENLRYGHTGFHELGLLVDNMMPSSRRFVPRVIKRRPNTFGSARTLAARFCSTTRTAT